ncbi:MAG: asparagine synthase (glutamine-hydrolyzing) [Myxococcota bacterium]
MCGIVGFVDPGGRTPDPERVLRAMRDVLTHRGPDDAGELFAPPLWMGHRRLAIVDLGEGGHQPFVLRGRDERSEVVVSANGEIYDHHALRRRIVHATPEARIAANDCAVIPWLWRLERERLPEVLGGMFGLAAWDARSGTLLLARDPAGQKPVYWAPLPGGGIAFASEPKALLLHPLVRREVDPVALRRYLAFDAVPGEATIYRQIRRVPPGGRVVWQVGESRVDRYFEAPPGTPRFRRLSDAGEALWGALGRAVEARLMSDVPLGVFLSGGLDSTAVVAALAERVVPADIRTFAVGFRDPGFDESEHARTVARHFGTDHYEELLEPSALVDLVPEILGILDEPFADPSIVPTFLLSRFTRRHVTVALGGDGGDELLLGHPAFFMEAVARWAARVPRAVRARTVEPLARRLPASTHHMSLDFELRRFLSGLDLPPTHRHPVWVGGVPPAEHAEALPASLLAQAPDDALFAEVDALAADFDARRPDAHPLERLAWLYFRNYLGDMVLTKVDRASMAHSLEARAPFLDREVLAVCARITVRHKLRGRTTKRVLRDVLARKVPESIAARPKKGFGIPVAAWLRGPLRPWMEHVLDPRRVAAGGLLDPAWTERLKAEHLSGRVNHRKPLWSAISLELWRTGRWGPG